MPSLDDALAAALVPACALLAGDSVACAVAASASAADACRRATSTPTAWIPSLGAGAVAVAVMAACWGGVCDLLDQRGCGVPHLFFALGGVGVAATLVPMAVSAAHSWRDLHLGEHERLISIQCILVAVMVCARAAWEEAASHAPGPRAHGDDVRRAVTTILGATAAIFLCLSATFRSHGRRNSRVILAEDATVAAAAVAAKQPPRPRLRGTRSSRRGAGDEDGTSNSNAEAPLLDDTSCTPADPPVRPPLPTLLVFAVLAGGIACEYAWLAAQLRTDPLGWVLRLTLDSPANLALVAWWAAVLVALMLAMDWMRRCDARDAAVEAGAADAGNGRSSATKRVVPTSRSSSTRRVGGCCSRHRPLLSIHRRNLLLRKAFHVAGFCMFAPAVAAGSGPRAFLALAFAVATQLLCCLEFGRSLRLPPVWLFGRVHDYMTQYTDERDCGVFVVTHIYLLLGCAVPLWASLFCVGGGSGGGSVGGGGGDAADVVDAPLPPLLLAASLAGITALGVGDAAAAVVGIVAAAAGRAHTWGDVLAPTPGTSWPLSPPLSAGRGGADKPAGAPLGVGENRVSSPTWPGARKTVEGSAAFVIASVGAVAAAAWLQQQLFLQSAPLLTHSTSSSATGGGSFVGLWGGGAMAAIWLCSTLTAGVETFSGAIDNLVLPPLYWALLVSAHLLLGGGR